MNQSTQSSSRYQSLLLGILVVFILSAPMVLVIILSDPNAKPLSQSITEKLLAIAVDRNLPKVSVQGKVVLPDGTPAPFCHVNIQSVGCTLNTDGTSSYVESSICSGSTKDDGTFQFDNFALPNSNVVVTVSGRDEYKRFVSEPIVFVAQDKMEPLSVTLIEGIPIRGRLTYDNSTPVANRTVYVEQELEPLIGADLLNIRNAFRGQRSCVTNENGEYEIYVTSGAYTIHSPHHKQSISVAENDESKEFNCVLPAPITVEVVSENGLELEQCEYTYTTSGNGTFSGRLKNDGIVVIDSISKEIDIFLLAADKKFGISETLTPEMNGKKIQVVLKQSAQVVLTVLDEKSKPLTGANVSVSCFTRKDNQHFWVLDSVKTDASGKATLHIPSGKLKIIIVLPWYYVTLNPDGSRSSHTSIEKEVNLAPDETFEIGTVILEKQ